MFRYALGSLDEALIRLGKFYLKAWTSCYSFNFNSYSRRVRILRLLVRLSSFLLNQELIVPQPTIPLINCLWFSLIFSTWLRQWLTSSPLHAWKPSPGQKHSQRTSPMRIKSEGRCERIWHDRNEITVLKRRLHSHVHYSIFPNSQDMGTT